MARLSDADIAKLKDQISLLRLVESQGYQPSRQGKDYVIACPFHEDDTPSLIISPKKNLFNCFGCGASGTVIDWVMKTQGVSFRFACEILQNDAGLVAESGTQTVQQNTATKLPPPLAAEADHQTALRQVIDYYHHTLKQSPEALAYLESRSLKSAELIDAFKLGFCQPDAGLSFAGEEPQSGCRAARQAAGDRVIAFIRP